jgi:hypothetical protein
MFLDPKSNFYLFFNLKTPLKHYINLKKSFYNSKTHQNHSKKQELIKSHKPNETQSIFFYNVGRKTTSIKLLSRK